MPITKSAKKALRSSERKRVHNLIWEKKLKKALKKADKDNASEVISIIDKTAKQNIITKNKAGRLKSKLAKKFGTPKKETKKVVGKPKKKSVARRIKKE